MNTIINENAITFKGLEKEIFKYICQMGQELTKEILESYDRHLMINRDKSVYRHKGLKTTTIKTLYGEVSYKHAVYRQTKEDGSIHHVFLLDEEMDICHTGLLSSNLMEKLLSGITEMSYRECADKVTSMTGQSISTMGVWDAVQKAGEEVCREEKEKLREHKGGKTSGKDRNAGIV